MRTILCSVLIFACFQTVGAASAIDAKTARIDDVELHYLAAGHGPTVILLHGFAETSRMWRPLIPLLTKNFSVIAPDLPGIGNSSIPSDRIDMLSAANRIHALVRSLGIEKARVVGHDIGLMVAYAYAAQFPAETEKQYFWNVLAADKAHSIPEADRKAYTEAYSRPGRMRAAWAYFASWPQLAKDFGKLSQTKLTMPVMSIGGDKSLGKELGEQAKLVTDNPTIIVLPNTGHWILEEKPKETTDALINFL